MEGIGPARPVAAGPGVGELRALRVVLRDGHVTDTVARQGAEAAVGRNRGRQARSVRAVTRADLYAVGLDEVLVEFHALGVVGTQDRVVLIVRGQRDVAGERARGIVVGGVDVANTIGGCDHGAGQVAAAVVVVGRNHPLVVRRGHDDAGGSALGVVTRDGGFGRPGRNLGGKGYQRARRVVVGSDRIAVAVREFLNVAGEPPRGIVVIRIGLAGARAGPHAGACQLARRVILLNGHSPVAVGRGCAVGRNPAPAIVEIRDYAAWPVSDKPARGDSSRIVVPYQDVAVNSNVGAVAWIGVDLARIAKRVGVIGGGVPLTEGNGNGAPVTIRVACRVRRAR